jgi:hypothetical protein
VRTLHGFAEQYYPRTLSPIVDYKYSIVVLRACVPSMPKRSKSTARAACMSSHIRKYIAHGKQQPQAVAIAAKLCHLQPPRAIKRR